MEGTDLVDGMQDDVEGPAQGNTRQRLTYKNPHTADMDATSYLRGREGIV